MRQKLFANDVPIRVWFWICYVAGQCWLFGAVAPRLWAGSSLWFWLTYAAAMALCFLLSHCVGLVLGWPLLGTFYHEQMLINGGPFLVGDRVQILSGPHSGSVTTIYSTAQGNAVRVDLGETLKEAYEDIYAPTRLLLVERPVDGKPPNE